MHHVRGLLRPLSAVALVTLAVLIVGIGMFYAVVFFPPLAWLSGTIWLLAFAYASQAMTLEPGDLIATGTPSGVGQARTPPVFMKPGDVVEIEIEGIPALRNTVVAAA